MKGHQIAFRNRSHELDFLIGIFSSHLIEVLDETFLSVAYQRIMLNILSADESLYRFGWIL
jgi:hypothetical protein